MDSSKIERYAPVILKLLHDVVSSNDQREWNLLLEHEYLVQEYFNRIGLEVYVNQIDGYAFVQQPDEDADGLKINLPRLTRSIPLTAAQTLLLILLRERLDDFFNQPQESDELILSEEELYRMMEPFMPERHDKRRLYQQISATIGQIERMGFLKVLSAEQKDTYIVQRILKSKVSSDVIANLKQQITEYYADAAQS